MIMFSYPEDMFENEIFTKNLVLKKQDLEYFYKCKFNPSLSL